MRSCDLGPNKPPTEKTEPQKRDPQPHLGTTTKEEGFAPWDNKTPRSGTYEVPGSSRMVRAVGMKGSQHLGAESRGKTKPTSSSTPPTKEMEQRP